MGENRLLVLGTVAFLFGARPAGADPLLRPEDRVAILQALSAADLNVSDLSFEKDYVQADGVLRDPWRLPGATDLLHAPMTVPQDASLFADALTTAAGDAHAGLAAGAAAFGWTLADPAAADPGPCQVTEAKVFKKLHPELQAAICLVGSLAAPDEATPAGMPAEAIETLRTMLAPDGEERWDATESQRRSADLLAAISALDLQKTIRTSQRSVESMQRVEAGLARVPAEAWPKALASFHLNNTEVQIGSLGPDRFTAPRTLDPGGDDLHIDPEGQRLSLHLDLGGDDTWRGGASTLGGSFGGVALLIDAAGDDSYRATATGSIGAGIAGVGILVDRAGDDSYRGVATTEGAGYAGIGLLMDGGGSDSYEAGAYAQGFAGVSGYGALWDGGGDDSYRAGGVYGDMPTRLPEHTLSLSQGFSIGMRPDAGGGLGILVDESGNDAYDADLFAQGCSYWFSRGYLIDRAGNDRYFTYQYGQGSGIHLSVGGLFDLAGNDAYTGGNLVQGSSHDLAVGWLYDRAGDDLYSANSTAQGGSLTNSVTFLLDAAGDDAYSFRLPFSRGQGRYDRHMGAIGVFVDVKGTDHYDRLLGDDKVARPWAYGVAVDNSALLPDPDAEIPAPPPRTLHAAPAEAVGRPTASPEVVAILAKADSVGCKDLPACEAARVELASHGPAAFEPLLVALPRDVLLEGYTIEALFTLLRSPENDPILHDMLLAHIAAGPAYPSMRWVVKWLGMLEVDKENTAAALEPLASSPDPRTRAALANALLAWKYAPPWIDSLLKDPDQSVRAAAVLALGEAGAPPDKLVAALLDDDALVRFDAAAALLARPADTVRASILALWQRGNFPSPATRRLVLELVIRTGGKSATPILRAVASSDADPWAKRKAAAALAGEQPFEWHPKQ